MKPIPHSKFQLPTFRVRVLAALLALLVPLGTAPVSLAAVYYWDSNDTTSLFGTAQSTWSTTTAGTTTGG